MTPSKRCTKCKMEKPLEAFYPKVKGGTQLLSRCKPCTNTDNAARAAADPKKATARSTAWRKANPGRASKISRAWQLRNPEQFKQMMWRGKYNIDLRAMWEAQEGKCASCGEPMLRDGKEVDSVCVDHDRNCCPEKKSCGKCVRGLIHRNCNLVLGYAKDNPEVLQSAIDYLKRWGDRRAI